MDRLLFLILVAILPVMQPWTVFVGPYPVVPADLVFIVLALNIAVLLLARRAHVVWTNWHTAIAAFALVTAISAATSSPLERPALKAAGTVYLVILGMLSSHYARSREMVRKIALAWVIGTVISVVAAGAGVLLFYAGDRQNVFLYGYGSLPPAPYPRVMALFLNANMLCSYLAASVMLVLAITQARWLPRIAGTAVLTATVAAAVLSFSPNLGGLALTMALWYAGSLSVADMARARMVRRLGAAAAIVFVLATLVSPTMLQRDFTATTTFEPSSRVQTWMGALTTFVEHPLLGAGPGADVAHVTYVNASHQVEFLTDAHNMWLSVLGQTGILGLACFGLAIGMLVTRMRTSIDLTPDGVWRTGCELALVAGVLYPSLSGSFEDTRHVWVLMGLVHGAQNPAGRQEETALRMTA